MASGNVSEVRQMLNSIIELIYVVTHFISLQYVSKKRYINIFPYFFLWYSEHLNNVSRFIIYASMCQTLVKNIYEKKNIFIFTQMERFIKAVENLSFILIFHFSIITRFI